MINPAEIDFSSLPWVSLDKADELPSAPGIYFAIDSFDQIQYIGRSSNVRGRWKSHHRYDDLAAIGGVRIVYLFVQAPELLSQVEAALIDWFDPPLNVARRRSEDCPLEGRRLKRLSASIPDRLYDRLEKLAEFEGRSVSSLVSYLLEHSVETKVEGYKREGQHPRSPQPQDVLIRKSQKADRS